MTWKELKDRCKQFNCSVGKTWINCYCLDFTKNNKIVMATYEGYKRTVIKCNVSYEDMFTIVTILGEDCRR